MDVLTIYRKGVVFWNVKLDNSSTQSKTLMGENVLNLTFTLPGYVAFEIGDYADAFSERYLINELPTVKKTGSNSFAYTLKMRAEGFDLSKAQYFGLAPDNSLTISEHYLTGTADVFIDLMLQNINRVSSGWIKGTVIPTGVKTLSFKSEDCYTVLGRIAQEFSTEFVIEGKTIHLDKRAIDTGYKFSVGSNKGLWEITRVNIDSTRVITRLYPYGANKNLPTTYSGNRLHLPPKPSHGNPCLISDITWFKRPDVYLQINWQAPQDPGVTSIEMVFGAVGSGTFSNSRTFLPGGPGLIAVAVGYAFDAKFISHGGACDGQETPVITIQGSNFQPIFPFVPTIYIEKNVNLYGIIEQTAIFDDIYPHRTGKVTSVSAGNPFIIVDANMDFDINAYLLPGLPAQITFMSGQLAGYTFDVSSYNDGTKTFTFLKNKNEQSIDVPSNVLRPAIGDEYVVTNITLPDAYIQAAEQELLDKAKDALDTYSEPQYTIQAVLDTIFMKNYQREVFAGNTIWIEDTQMQINRKIRIVTCIRNLVEPFSFQVTLSDIIEVGTKDKIFSSIQTSQRSVDNLGNQVVTRDIFNGNLILPTNPGGAGFENVIVEVATSKLYRQQ